MKFAINVLIQAHFSVPADDELLLFALQRASQQRERERERGLEFMAIHSVQLALIFSISDRAPEKFTPQQISTPFCLSRNIIGHVFSQENPFT